MIFTPFKFSANENGTLNFESIFKNNTSAIDADVKALNNYNNAVTNGLNAQSAFYEFLDKKSTVAAQDFAASAKGAAVNVDQFTVAQKGATQASRLAVVGAKALNFALNAGITMFASWAISKVVEGINNLITAQQRAIDTANDLQTAYNNTKDATESNISTLQSLQNEFDELSKGVDSNGKNIGLSTEQYKRYHEIVKQIVDISPSLVQGYDNEGNAIINNNSALQTAIDLQKQKLELEREEFVFKNGSDYLKGAQADIDQARGNISGGNFNGANYGRDLIKSIYGSDWNKLSELNTIKIQLQSVGLDYFKIASGNVEENRKLVAQQDTIIAKLGEENHLTDEQKIKVKEVIQNIQSQIGAVDVGIQEKINYANELSQMLQNESWYSKITSSNAISAFDKQIREFVELNPDISFTGFQSGIEKIGKAFASIQSQIPTAKIAELQNQYKAGKINNDDYNKSLQAQIQVIDDLAIKYPGLAVMLKTIADSYRDFANVQSNSAENTLSNVLSNFDTQEKSAQTAINTLADSLKDLNVAIDDNQKGTLLSGDTVSNLLSKYPILYKSIIDTGNGYKFVKGALEDVRKAQIKEQEDAINAQIATAKQTLASTQDRIKAYAKEIGAISTLAQAQSRLAEMTQTTSIAIHDPNIRNGFDTESQEARAELAKYNEAKSELAAFANAADEIKKGQDEIGALEKQLSLVSSGNYQKTDQTAEDKANKEAQKQENTALKNAEALLSYRRQMGVYTSDNLFKQIQLDQQYVKATENLKKYAKTTDEIREVNEKIKSAQDELATAQKNYAQDVLDTSKKELENRQQLGVVLDGTVAKLQNLNEIYKNLTTNSMMSPINTEENRAELEQEIYDTKKGILEAESTELDNEVNLGKIQEGTLEYLQRLQKIQSDISKSDLGAADKTTELQSINEKIYSARQSYNESQINEIDHLVSIGKLQENSLEYIQKLNSLYRSLNLTLEQRESLQEKIFSAEKGYISQLESDLTDESIEGSYGAQIKAIQDKIDAIDKENDATSKQIALEKAQAALEEARNQKTISIFRENQGFVYEADQSDVLEKQQAVSDAKREEEIQKLTEQKNKIQSEADNMKSQLEKVLHDLDGSNKKTWDSIQDEIDDVIEDVDEVFRIHTSKTKSYYNDIDNALDESTENTENDYQLQLDSAQNYFDEIQELQPKIVAQNNKIANSFQRIADALYNMNGQYDRMGRAIRYAEEDREQANIDYNEFNQSMKEDHQTIKYASGTQYSVGGLAQTDEEGYELKLQNLGNGKYTLLNEGSIVFPADATKNLWNLANNPQLAMLKAGLQNRVNIPNVINRNSESNHNDYHINKIEFPNATDRNEIKQAFTELPTYFLQKSYSNK